jgi:hypothetical protein
VLKTPAAVPAKDPVTVSCLWTNQTTGGPQLTDPTRYGPVAWVAEATAMARVTVEDAALDADAPYGGTIFDGAERVEYRGGRFRVLQVDPVGPGFAAPSTYAVWLTGVFQSA